MSDQSYLPGQAPHARIFRRPRGKAIKKKPEKTSIRIPEVERNLAKQLKALAKAANVDYSTYLLRILKAHVARVQNPLGR